MTNRFQLPCLLAALLFSLSACTDRTTTSADVDAAAEKTKDAALVAGRKAAELAEKARDNTKAYLSSPEVKRDVESAKDAVKGAVDGARDGVRREAPKP
ncbi:MAG: hypothetical protein EOO26_10880 [Comamonadaceae bacterium]|nr:MAG: hypothetical protein EOO26_10880 [Comamonadaceae bacterium]